MTPRRNAVILIDAVRPWNQVTRIHAGGAVASMHNEYLLRVFHVVNDFDDPSMRRMHITTAKLSVAFSQ